MTTLRQENFRRRKEKILAMAEVLLLENHNDITLSGVGPAEMTLPKAQFINISKVKISSI